MMRADESADTLRFYRCTDADDTVRIRRLPYPTEAIEAYKVQRTIRSWFTDIKRKLYAAEKMEARTTAEREAMFAKLMARIAEDEAEEWEWLRLRAKHGGKS